MPVLTPLVVQI